MSSSSTEFVVTNRRNAKPSGAHPDDQTTSLNGRTKDSGRIRAQDTGSDQTRQVLSWKEIPAWMRDEYILSGYRREQNSILGCLHSVYAYIHNETINIHTHLWAAILFAFFLADFYRHMNQYSTTNFYDVAGFVVFLVSAVTCLSLSASYHTFCCHSKKIHDIFHRLDFSGIVVLIVGSFFPCIYYGFYCTPYVQVMYLSAICLAGGAASYIVLSPEYSRPTHRGARTAVFIGLGLSGVFPMIHGFHTYGIRTLVLEMGFLWVLISGALYILGALIYANKIPEKWFVNSSNRFFDNWLSSHQIFHMHVVVAAVTHYSFVLKALHHRHGTLTGTCPLTL